MGKETFYFQHDYEPTSDLKIQTLLIKYGGMGYGLFWRIIETLHSSESHRIELKEYILLSLANQMLTSVEQVKEIIDYLINPCELLITDGISIWSSRVDNYFDWRNSISKKCAEAGHLGGLRKQANAKQKLANA